MMRSGVVVAWLLGSVVWAQAEAQLPSFGYEVARTHEVEPHRRTVPLDGVQMGFNQLHISLTVSSSGDVTKADASGDKEVLKFWPQVQGEVLQWKFFPFEKDGVPVTAEVEEYIDLVPPEQLPKVHAVAPRINPHSKVTITLGRSGCMGSCPAYTVDVSTDGIVFEGGGSVVAAGKHEDTADASGVRKLAQEFVAADFYSMGGSYAASATDLPTYSLSISIDGQKASAIDYEGQWVGMPAVIVDLEEKVDAFARTDRWVSGSAGLVAALKAEKFDFKAFEAQVVLKEALARGRTATVRELLEAGVPLKPLPAPKPKDEYRGIPFDHVGWLNAASKSVETLRLLIQAGASKADQNDKDLALVGAASSGSVEAVRALIAYGADPNADLRKLTITERGGGMTLEGPGAGSVLIYAARSGNPEAVREILRYHPKLESRDREGQTAMFAAGDYRDTDADGARVEIVRLLAHAGAKVNARDNDGNTPLHETFLTDVEEELLKLGADVNARNKDGETPIFTTVDDDAIPLFLKRGADLTIRNRKGETVMEEAVAHKGPQRQEALRKAIAGMKDGK